MARHFVWYNFAVLYNTTPAVTVTPISMACWFYADDITRQFCFVDVIHHAGGAGGDFFAIGGDGTQGGDPVFAMAYETGLANVHADSTAGYSVSTWHHACGVFTGTTTCVIYLDGGNKATAVAARTPAGFDQTQVGALHRNHATSWPMNGRIAEAAIWDAALTDAEAAILATGIRPIFVRPQNIVAYWPLVRDQDYDIVGGYDLTVWNNPTIAEHAPVIYGASFYGMNPRTPSPYFIGRIGRLGGRANVPSTDIDDHANMLFQSTRSLYAE